MTTIPGRPVPVTGPQRPPLERPHGGRALAGVAAGLAVHLGLPVRAVRIALLLSTVLGGAGPLLYLWLWAFVPSGPAADGNGRPKGAAVAPTGVRGRHGERSRGGRVVPRRGDLWVGAALLLAGLSVFGTWIGWDLRPGITVPVAVVASGALLAYAQLDEVERSRWAARTGVGSRAAAWRVGGGLLLVLTGTLMFLLQSSDVVTAGRALVATVAVLAGTALVLAPWGVRLWRDLDAERAGRIRESERADIAAHLHDSVLQTLSLIQRHSGDPAAVTRLARAQERDLRDWLYGPRTVGGIMLAGEVRTAAADVEDRHGVAVEVVLVGDRPMDDRLTALVGALREAMVNAARHAGGPVQVYVECGPDRVEAFVRDRGQGFSLDAVPADRLGVRESIIGRMERHGGGATVRSRPGEGTEVRLELPVVGDGSAVESGPGVTVPGEGSAS